MRVALRLALATTLVVLFGLSSAVGETPAAVPLPPYAGAYQPQTADERGAWMMADEAERSLRDSPALIGDPALNAYLQRVLCRTVGQDRCRGIRIYILRVADVNASMMANGTLQIWSGILLRMQNEAELAGVLGHEFAHFERRHQLNHFRKARTATDIAAWAGLADGRYGPTVAFSAQTSIYAFGRAQETESDMLSSRYMQASHYDGHSVGAFWERLMDEADATALGRHRRSTRFDRVSYFDTHPATLERARAFHAAAASAPGGGDDEHAAWAAALARWREAWLEDQLKLNDFGGTEYLLAQLGRDGWTQDLLFARGELYRMRGNPRDLIAAADFYREAIILAPDHAEAHRGLGLTLLRRGREVDAETGRAELRRYLTLKPAATDAAMMAALVS